MLRYKIGDSFVLLPLVQCMERIGKEQSVLNSDLEECEKKVNAIDAQLKDLKTQLYSKFGKSINLEY